MEKTADHCSDHIHGNVVESNGEQIHLEPELQEGPGPGGKHHSLAVKHQIRGPALMISSRVWRKSEEAQGPSCCSSKLRCPLHDNWSPPGSSGQGAGGGAGQGVGSGLRWTI